MSFPSVYHLNPQLSGAANHRSLANGSQQHATAQQLGRSNPGRVRDERRCVTGVSPYAGRTPSLGGRESHLKETPSATS
jgi:hypothetical protein